MRTLIVETRDQRARTSGSAGPAGNVPGRGWINVAGVERTLATALPCGHTAPGSSTHWASTTTSSPAANPWGPTRPGSGTGAPAHVPSPLPERQSTNYGHLGIIPGDPT